jgi:hypothetical protein
MVQPDSTSATEAREAIRDAILSGELTPDEAAAAWPQDDPYAGIAKFAAQFMRELDDVDEL